MFRASDIILSPWPAPSDLAPRLLNTDTRISHPDSALRHILSLHLDAATTTPPPYTLLTYLPYVPASLVTALQHHPDGDGGLRPIYHCRCLGLLPVAGAA